MGPDEYDWALLGDRIRWVREVALGLSQRGLASWMEGQGIEDSSHQSVKRYEADIRKPKPDYLTALGQRAQIDGSWLLYGSGSPPVVWSEGGHASFEEWAEEIGVPEDKREAAESTVGMVLFGRGARQGAQPWIRPDHPDFEGWTPTPPDVVILRRQPGDPGLAGYEGLHDRPDAQEVHEDREVYPLDLQGRPVESDVEVILGWVPEDMSSRWQKHVTLEVRLAQVYAYGTTVGWSSDRLEYVHKTRERVEALRRSQDLS